MKNKKITKAISIIMLTMIILISPLGSYIQGENSKAYASEVALETIITKFMFPIAAYLVGQQLASNGAYETNNATAQNIAETIDDMKNFKTALVETVPVIAKIKLLKLYTDMSNYEINKAIGTTFPDVQMSNWDNEVAALRIKITNNQTLTNADLYGLGIHNILANYYKSKVKELSNLDLISNNGNLSTVYLNGISYVKYSSGEYSALSPVQQFDNSEFIKLINGIYKYTCNSGNFQRIKIVTKWWTFFNPLATFKLHLSNMYTLGLSYGTYGYENDDSNQIYLNTTYDLITLKIIDISNSNIIKSYNFGPSQVKAFLEFISPYCSSDVINSKFYVNSTTYNLYDLLGIKRLGTISFTPDGIYLGNNSISGVTSKTIDDTNAPDTSLTQAERIIANKDVNVTYDNNVQAVPNQNTGDEDIVITPTDTTIPATSSADTNTADPDTGAVVSPDGKLFNIPILGELLKWLIKIWNMIKSIFDSIANWFTNNPKVSEEGGDWGNFKGFFDIFYIFYYLIILAIIILIKFFGVILSVLDIPANSALFNQYPSILAGLNYLKNLKVGGFDITIQQIFEYMFTVFFFLYIVTTLQKLYHNFSLIERQTIKQQDKWRDDNRIRYDESSDTAVNKLTGEIQDYKYK